MRNCTAFWGWCILNTCVSFFPIRTCDVWHSVYCFRSHPAPPGSHRLFHNASRKNTSPFEILLRCVDCYPSLFIWCISKKDDSHHRSVWEEVGILTGWHHLKHRRYLLKGFFLPTLNYYNYDQIVLYCSDKYTTKCKTYKWTNYLIINSMQGVSQKIACVCRIIC